MMPGICRSIHNNTLKTSIGLTYKKNSGLVQTKFDAVGKQNEVNSLSQLLKALAMINLEIKLNRNSQIMPSFEFSVCLCHIDWKLLVEGVQKINNYIL